MESKTFEQKLKDLDDLIKNTQEFFLPPHGDIVSVYLQQSFEEMRLLSNKECAEISTSLSQLSYSVSLQFNKVSAKYNYLNEKLNSLIYPKFKDYDQYKSSEEKKYLIISEDSYLKKMHDELIKIKMSLDLIYGISMKLDALSNSYRNLSYSKREGRNG